MTVPMKERGREGTRGDSRIPATSFMPDADELSGMHDMDLDASAMDQDGERPAHCVTIVYTIYN